MRLASSCSRGSFFLGAGRSCCAAFCMQHLSGCLNSVSSVHKQTYSHTHTQAEKIHTHTHRKVQGKGHRRGEWVEKSLYTMQNCVRPHFGRGRVRNHRRWCCQRFVPPLLQRAAHFKSCNNNKSNNKSCKARRTFRGTFLSTNTAGSIYRV